MAVDVATVSEQCNVRFTNLHAQVHNDVEDILSGLKQTKKTINPRFFYDSKGSQLFEDITQTEEYYPTRTERNILWENRFDIAKTTGVGKVLVEPGSGSSEKVRLLLDALQPSAYVPIDIAADFLQAASHQLGEEFDWLPIHALCADFSALQVLPNTLPAGPRVIFYPGSTLGNMHPEQAVLFLQTLHHWLIDESHAMGGILIGIDLHKEVAILNAAYNDKDGITAAFNLNALSNINRIAKADFQLANFQHHAFYNQPERRIEMHLISQCDHWVTIAGERIPFSKGESIHTENSYKYTVDGFDRLVQSAGFKRKNSWLDEKQYFSFHYLEANPI